MEEKKTNLEKKVSKETNKDEKIIEKEKVSKTKEVKQKETKEPEKEVKENKEEVKIENKKDDTSFKKVQNGTERKKKIDEIEQKGKKKHGVAKAVLILIMIFIATYCVFFARNLIILNSIADKIKDYEDISSYSYTTTIKNDEEVVKTKIQYYKKDNRERFDFQREDINLIWWYDSDTNEKIVSTPVSKKATISNTEDVEIVHLPIESSLKSKGTTAYMSLYSRIYSDKYNSKDCYVIDMGNNDKIWIDKETGIVVKRKNASDQGEIEYTDINLNYEGEIYKPDLTGYDINYAE